MGPLDLVGERFADIVQECSASRLLFVQPQFRGHRAADKRRFDRMHQNVLCIAVSVFEHAEQFRQFGMDAMDTNFDECALSGFLDRFLNLLFGLAHHLLDSPRMDSPVGDQPFERNAGDFSANRIVARDHDGFGGIVDDNIDARAASIARMLRPSRPMMRPFISSLGSANTETVRSATNSPASRSIAIEMMRLARRSASSRASSSTIRI